VPQKPIKGEKNPGKSPTKNGLKREKTPEEKTLELGLWPGRSLPGETLGVKGGN